MRLHTGLVFRGARGFTLIELLVVIAIIAVLAVAVVISLNPAELLKQARDSTRVADMGTLKSAIGFFMSDTGGQSIGSVTDCYAHASSSVVCANRFAGGGTAVTSTSVAPDGTGWIPIDFTSISSGSPISVIAVDPVNDSTYFYAYKGDSATAVFETNANMESVSYQNGGSADVESTDGGDNSDLHEAGTSVAL